MGAKRLLVIDDEVDIANFIAEVASRDGVEVRTTTDPVEFKTMYQSFQPDLIMLDVIMPDVDGIELVRFLAGQQTAARLAIMSGYSGRYLEHALRIGEAFGLGHISILQKPIGIDALRAWLRETNPGN